MTVSRILKVSAMFIVGVALGGCSMVNDYLGESRQEVGYYRVYDVKTSERPQALIRVLQEAIASEGQANFSVTTRYLNNPSKKPSRFHPLGLVNPEQETMNRNDPQFAGYRAISCPRAAWTANAVRNDGTYFQACLYAYKEGYQLDLFARYLKKRGKISNLKTSVVNYAGKETDETWAEAFFVQIPQQIESSLNAQVKLIESLPPTH